MSFKRGDVQVSDEPLSGPGLCVSNSTETRQWVFRGETQDLQCLGSLLTHCWSLEKLAEASCRKIVFLLGLVHSSCFFSHRPHVGRISSPNRSTMDTACSKAIRTLGGQFGEIFRAPADVPLHASLGKG